MKISAATGSAPTSSTPRATCACSKSFQRPRPIADDLAVITHFCDQRLGKAVVPSRDTPNFIANRIGTFSMGNAIRLMQAQELTIEEVDALTGSPLGWPRTGTFRLGDLVGVDVLAHVAKNFAAQASRINDERPDVTLAPFITQMLENKWLGDKVGQGFYKKAGKDEQGRDLRHVLDWQTLDYRPRPAPNSPPSRWPKTSRQTAARIKQLLHADPEKDKAAKPSTGHSSPSSSPTPPTASPPIGSNPPQHR